MAKRLAVLVAMLAMMMGMALPASAESEPQLTGVIEKPEVTSYMYGTHSMTDEVGGDLYALESEVVDLDAYVGQRVTVFGASVPGYENGQVEGGPPLFEVTRVEPARGPVDPVAATFELTVEGEVPAGGLFQGFVGTPRGTAFDEACVGPLLDEDGDGVYALECFAERGAELPVVLDYTSPEGENTVVKDFGVVTFDEDKTFSASFSFDGDGGAPVVSGDTNSDKDGRTTLGGADAGTRVLPATGGVTVAAALGALLMAGGLIARRIYR
ncbi:MAG: hypothetical protein M3Q49_13995 [Actinomycetota bacterium]|nr:hypothetical protein [Actinomycetota bacterium]MDP9486870.1 hypothetical protein [Actinomycetota bacterium]